MPAPAKGLPQRFDLSDFLFNAAGRIGRSRFSVGLFCLFCAEFAVLFGLHFAKAPGAVPAAAFFFWWVNGTLTARRLHDVGLSGWWYAPFSALSWLWTSTFAGPVWAFWALFAPVGLASLFLLLWPGDARFNRFGPPPG